MRVITRRIPPEEIRVDHIDVVSFVQRLRYLIDQFLTHDVTVHLLGSANVQGEPPYFAADFALTGLVAVILGTRGGEFRDEVAVINSFVVSRRLSPGGMRSCPGLVV